MIRIAALVIALMLTKAASACSCAFVEPAGFVHATLKRLPANASGALFLTPQGDPPPMLDASLFSITSDRDTGQLKAILSYPDVGTNRYEERAFPPIVCAQPVFAATALGEGRDLIQANCKAPGGDRSIRGQAGFLELEDRLQATAPIRTNLSKACNGMSRLKADRFCP